MFDINLGSQGFREHVYIKPAYNPAYNKNRQKEIWDQLFTPNANKSLTGMFRPCWGPNSLTQITTG